MSDTTIRHLLSIIGTIVFFLVYLAGYISGTLGWWFTGIGVIAIYFIIFTLVNV